MSKEVVQEEPGGITIEQLGDAVRDLFNEIAIEGNIVLQYDLLKLNGKVVGEYTITVKRDKDNNIAILANDDVIGGYTQEYLTKIIVDAVLDNRVFSAVVIHSWCLDVLGIENVNLVRHKSTMFIVRELTSIHNVQVLDTLIDVTDDEGNIINSSTQRLMKETSDGTED